MSTQPTASHCALFGHNYIRFSESIITPDLVRCKHCNHEQQMSASGDYEIEDDRTEVFKVMQRLFLLKRSHKKMRKKYAI